MTRHEFIFTDKFPHRLYRHIMFWLVYYLFFLLTYFHPFLEKTTFAKWVMDEVVESLCHVSCQILFCYTLLYLLWPKLLNRKKYLAFCTGLILLFLIINGIYYIQHSTIFKSLHAYAGMPFMKQNLFTWFGLIAILSYVPISSGVAVAIKILKQFYNKQKENQQLTTENAKAELQLLKAQIHPHFLFNTLNNIYAFTLNRSMQAPELVTNLSNTLKYMISDCDADLVFLSQELNMINDYINLEKVRYGNRLIMQIEISGETKDKNIAPLLMIPFVENSFKHGTSKMLKGPWIKLFIQTDENVLHFSLINNKPAKENISGKKGIGLNNVKKRLELLYPQNHLLTIESTAHTFTVNMQIPLQKIEKDVIV